MFDLRVGRSQALANSTDISEALQAWFHQTVAAIGTGDDVPDPPAMAPFELIECRCAAVLDLFDQAGEQTEDALSAIVLRALHGPFSGVGLLAMASRNAVAWVRELAPSADPEQTFALQADSLLVSMIEAATASLGGSPVLGDAHFEESAFAACVAGTHAPLDTLLVQASILLPSSEGQVVARLCLLLEPKAVDALGLNRD